MNLANKLTMLRILLIPFFMALVFIDFPAANLWAAVIFVFAAATDGLDGYIARKRKEITNLGKLLDPLADKLLVAAALIALVETSRIPSWIATIIIGRELMVTGLRGVAAEEGLVIAAGKLAKVKTLFQILALTILLVERDFFAIPGFSPGSWLLYLAMFLTVYTGYDYMAKTFTQIKMT